MWSSDYVNNFFHKNKTRNLTNTIIIQKYYSKNKNKDLTKGNIQSSINKIWFDLEISIVNILHN